MSTPSPANNITLPSTRSYVVTIDSNHYQNSGMTTLSFIPGLDDKWTAHYTVADTDGKTILAETGLEVSAPEVTMYVFSFELADPNEAQQEAGYIAGKYVFSFAPPGSDPAMFFGLLSDPRPGDEEDNWTAKGNDPEKSD